MDDKATIIGMILSLCMFLTFANFYDGEKAKGRHEETMSELRALRAAVEQYGSVEGK